MARKNTIDSSLKKFDLFSKNISFRENGEDAFGSIFGAVTSIMILFVVGIYGMNKFRIMLDHEDTNFNEYTEKNGLGLEEIDSRKLNF